ncbi:MAG: spore germination protein [Desulfotomaculaceae bacterium]|nr:spore germination protein [Desulfotomaculaceae bacterium]MDD4766162.1 spore germination protein [Desulfotomaculaceae bacterium]
MLRLFQKVNRKAKKIASSGPKQVPLPHAFKDISSSLADNEAYLRQEFVDISDIIFRQFYVAEVKFLAVWFDGLINNRVSHDIFRALMLDIPEGQLLEVAKEKRAELINKSFLPFYRTSQVTDLGEIKRWILMSKMVLLVDGCPSALMIDAEDRPQRPIAEPVIEPSVVGPHDSFTENIRINTALIRSRLGDAMLKSEDYIIGRRSNTLVTLLYVADIANPKIVEEARRRLSRIDTDGIIDSSHIRELIQDRAYSLFPTMKSTERPDIVVADLLEGRFALVVDGSPQVLTAPSIFIEFLQAADDYYINPMVAWFIRALRYMSIFIATNLPGIYVALVTFHHEMIPIPLVFSIAGARETVPFPAYFDALFLLIIFELLWESSIRLPRVVGAAINIVGALILGQAAVQSNLVSPTLVIVIAISAVANFSLGSGYALALSVRVIRLAILTAGGILGLYGIALTSLAFLIHMAGLRSFGVPYFEPLAPLILKETKDTLYRSPRWDVTDRPALIAGNDITRDNTPPPAPPTDNSSSSDPGSKKHSRRGGR